MIITCEQCQARFRMADEKLKPGGTKVRCSKCKHVFTVLPPEPPPTGEVVDFGDFNMERIPDEESAPASPPSTAFAPPAAPPEPPVTPATLPGPPPETAPGEMDLDFSSLEQSMGPATGSGDLAEEFSFADTSAAEPAAAAETFITEAIGEEDTHAGELDFDTTFAESEEPSAIQPTAGPAESAFDQELAHGEADEASSTFDFGTEAKAPPAFDFGAEAEAPTPAEFGELDLGTETPPPAEGEFRFDSEPDAQGLSEFSFETAAGEGAFAPGEAPAPTDAAASFEFGSDDSFESSAETTEAAFGESWSQPEKESGLSFDFDEPSFESRTEEKVTKGKEEAGLSFGEIDFSDEAAEVPPSFGGEPDFSQATVARPAEAAVPPPLPPSPRPASERPRSVEPLPAPQPPRKSPLSRMLLLLVLLLLLLCGVGGYFLFMGDGRQIIDTMLMKLKGEEPAVPVEQRIGLNISGSSYVSNREAGQLLVVQGSATNNFSTTRTAISVKGVLLDAAGRVLQQQTVFCGNYLDEEKLRTMKYAQIEEAMNNQFGDSLSNMNVTPGKVLRFTIVFRNVPKEMANINVEVVDSKPGGT